MVTKDFAELFACFNVRGVRAVVVGGYALAFHAKPRFTKDIDIFDLLTAIDGVSFADAWAGRVAGRYGDHAVFYLGLDELRRNKRASGRPQDLADLEALG